MSITEHARLFAAKAHDEQKRKYTFDPYTVHTEAVAKILASIGARPEVIAAGYLHDVLEDTNVTPEMMRAEFGSEVTDLVLEVTDVSKPSDGNRAFRKTLDLMHLANASAEGQSIKLADLIDNTSSIVAHDAGFAKIYLKEKEALLGVLIKGHPLLHEKATKILNNAKHILALYYTPG